MMRTEPLYSESKDPRIRDAALFMYETFWPWFRKQVYSTNLNLPPDELIQIYNENANKIIAGFRHDPPSVLDPDDFTDAVPKWMQEKVRESLAVLKYLQGEQ